LISFTPSSPPQGVVERRAEEVLDVGQDVRAVPGSYARREIGLNPRLRRAEVCFIAVSCAQALTVPASLAGAVDDVVSRSSVELVHRIGSEATRASVEDIVSAASSEYVGAEVPPQSVVLSISDDYVVVRGAEDVLDPCDRVRPLTGDAVACEVDDHCSSG
jgi:hypothetical protein